MTFSWLCIDKKRMCPNVKSLIPEFLVFCYWHNKLVIGLRVVQFRSNRARYFKSLDRLLPELYSTQAYYPTYCCGISVPVYDSFLNLRDKTTMNVGNSFSEPLIHWKLQKFLWLLFNSHCSPILTLKSYWSSKHSNRQPQKLNWHSHTACYFYCKQLICESSESKDSDWIVGGC